MSFARAKSGLFVSCQVKIIVCALSLLVSSFGVAFEVHGEVSGYRSGERFVEHPPVKVSEFLSYGDEVLSPGAYLIRVRAGRILFADAELRQVRLRAPCKLSVSKRSYPQPEISVTQSGGYRRIRYVYRAWSCSVDLRKVERPKAETEDTQDVPELKKLRRTISSGVYDEPDSYELVTRMLERRALELKPCLKRAERRGSRLTDEELTKCMCSLSKTWKLPMVEKPLAIALRVVPFPFGLAFEHSPGGIRKDCRGWIGRGPVKSGVEVGGLWLEVMDEGYTP